MILVTLLIIPTSGCSLKSAATVKIGAIYPLTGAQAENGKDIQRGLLLATDIINNSYNLDMPLAGSEGLSALNGARIEILFADSQGSDTVGQSEAQKLIEQDHVAALIGCYQSSVTASASQAAEDKGVPFLSDTSTAPSLTRRGYQWFFRTTPDDVTFIQNYFQFLNEIQHKTGSDYGKIGIVAENSIFGSEFASIVEQDAPNNGFRIVENISYSSATPSVDSEVQRLQNANPDIIMQASYTEDAILYMETYKLSGLSPAAILTDDAGFNDPQFIQRLGSDSNFVFTRDLWSREWAADDPLADSVNRIFVDRYQTDMTSDSTRAFTGLIVLADAVQRAGSVNPSAIRDALLSTNYSGDNLIVPWNGVRFDPRTHQNTLANGLISQIINLEYRTVWPGNLAGIEPVWPMPAWSSRKK
jgi:branched-chain amino acid transport system substrate-binding protein